MLRSAISLLILVLLLAAVQVRAQEGLLEPDWDALQSDAVAMLVDLIRIDTSQPEGNELLAARYLRDRLARAGVEATLYESAPGRANLVARLRGNGDRKPLLLVGHLDVVGAEAESWGIDPFAGVIRGGRLYGRGALDAKGIVAAAFTLLIHLSRLDLELDRDLVVLAAADEEAGGVLGIDYMLARHRADIDAEFALNEGGGGEIDAESGSYLSFNIGTAEKTPRRARLTVVSQASHGSVPSDANAILQLSRAITRLSEAPLEARLNATTRAFFAQLAAAMQGEIAEVYEAILAPDIATEAQARLQEINASHYAMLRTTVVPTMIEGGYQHNVIPSRAEAILDIRALPDEDPDQLFDTLRRIAATPGLQITPLQVGRPAHEPSPLASELYQALASVLRERHPKALILPTMNTGASDSAQLRAAGIPSYGFGPGVLPVAAQGVHGSDEHVLLGAYHEYLQILWQLILRVGHVHRAPTR